MPETGISSRGSDMKTKLQLLLLCAFALYASAQADVVILQSGQIITGTVLQQDSEGTLLQMDYGTFRYPSSQVKDVRKEKVTSSAEAEQQRQLRSGLSNIVFVISCKPSARTWRPGFFKMVTDRTRYLFLVPQHTSA